MEEKIEILIKKYPKLHFERKVDTFLKEDGEPEEFVEYEITGIQGNPNLIVRVWDEKDADILTELLEQEFTIIPEFFGLKNDGNIEIALLPINSRTSMMSRRLMAMKPVCFELNYFKNKLEIQIQHKPDNSLLSKLMEIVRGGRGRTNSIIKISGFTKKTGNEFVDDIRNILNSVLFDFSYAYNLAFEPVPIESLQRRVALRSRNKTSVPEEKFNFVFKKYIPELIEYYNIGEKVDYAPFRFICYFHIIEYFLDKSAFHVAAEKLKSIIQKPDFHLNTNKYVNQAINFFKIEAGKHTSDKVKISRVLSQFIDKEELKSYLEEIELYDYFTKPCSIECSKTIELKAINFESDNQFHTTLMNRIYTIRCSIVHSNPDFDENFAVPFSPTMANMEKLRIENNLMIELARTIIMESKVE